MILGTFIKQPSDVNDYDVEYQDWLSGNDTVANAVVTVDPDGNLAIDNVFVVSPRINIWLSGGLNGATYKLTVTVTTTEGRVRQDEFRVKVKEY